MEDKHYQEKAFRLKVLSTMLMKISKQDVDRRLAKAGVDISPLALAVLRFAKHEPSTIYELSKKMLLAPASLVPVIDSLDSNGLITRGTDPDDRRKKPLSITPKGAGILSKVPMVTKEDILAKTLQKMEEKRSSLLLKMMEELVAELSGDDGLCKRISDIAAKEYGPKV